MIELGSIFLSSLFLSIGIYLLRHRFYALAVQSFALLNTLLATHENEDIKQRRLISGVWKLISVLLQVLLGVCIICFLVYIPLYFQFHLGSPSVIPNTLSLRISLTILLGGSIPFLFVSFLKKKEAYSQASITLHRIILDNYHVSRLLFSWEKRMFKKKLNVSEQPYVIVSGLPRSGTSAMTRLLFSTGTFHSLQYSHMPFLLSPNLWGIIHRKSKVPLQQRHHKDGLYIDLNTIEAFEEYFFKVFTQDVFIHANCLKFHDLDQETQQAYISYQALLKKDPNSKTLYLAKNNNLLLRYTSLQKYSQEMHSIFLFREPIEQANSLLRQHRHFCELQRKSLFVKEYMDWLGHHEFGLGFKGMEFPEITSPLLYPLDSIDYWLAYWISYYTHFLSIWDRESTLLIYQKDLRNQPQQVLNVIGSKLGRVLTSDFSSPTPIYQTLSERPANPELLKKSQKVFNKLLSERSI